MTTIRQLEYLVALADALHFGHAAEKVHTTQPTLSTQLKVLEEQLGVQLIERDRHHVIVTAVGEEIVAIARQVLRDVRDMRDTANLHRRGVSGLVRIGIPPTLAPYFLPRVLPEVNRTHPDLRLRVKEDLPQALASALADGAHDLIIGPLPFANDEFDTFPLYREPLCLVTASDHPLAKLTAISRSDLSGAQVLALGPGHQLHQTVRALCDSLNARLLFDYEGTSLDTLREMVAIGAGISFFPGLYVRTTLDGLVHVKAIEIDGLCVKRTVAMAWRRTSARRPHFERLAQLFSNAILNDFPDFAPDGTSAE